VSRIALALLGPTASGKTDVAISLAQRFPVEIISVDASQVYLGMDIGTAKPDALTLKRAPHHLIDFRDPANAYSAAEFSRDGRLVMQQIHDRGRIPLIVGGSMFYYQSLVNGLNPLPSAQPDFRRNLRQRARQSGWPGLHRELLGLDPAAAARINENDAQRIERALEIIEFTGQAIEPDRQNNSGDWSHFTMALVAADRATVHERIRVRFQEMLDQGFEQEVEKLLVRLEDVDDLPALRTVGYRQMAMYLRAEVSYEMMQDQALAATRQLAKRQLTWLRHRPGTIWCCSTVTGFDDAISRLVSSKLGGACV